MLYKMKEALHEFRAAYNKLDPEWQEWLKQRVNIEVARVIVIHDALENLEMNELDIDPYEVETLIEVREQGEDMYLRGEF